MKTKNKLEPWAQILKEASFFYSTVPGPYELIIKKGNAATTVFWFDLSGKTISWPHKLK